MQKTTSPQIKTREEKGIKTVFVPLYQSSGRNNQKKLFECYASMTKQPKEPGLRVFRVWKMQIFPREICFPVQLSQSSIWFINTTQRGYFHLQLKVLNGREQLGKRRANQILKPKSMATPSRAPGGIINCLQSFLSGG